LLSLTDTMSTTTTITATGSTTDPVSSKLTAGLEILALAPRPPGVEICPAWQAFPVPVASTTTV